MPLRCWIGTAIVAAAAAFHTAPAMAEAPIERVSIGVLTDMSGPYAAFSGRGSVVAAQLAAEDFKRESELKVDVVSADHLNKPDVASGIARRWIDVDNISAIVDMPNSAAALAVSEIVREKNRTLLISGSSSSDLYGKACSPNSVMWTYDSYSVAKAIGRAVVRSGGDSWFILMVDNAAGHALQRDLQAEIEGSGGAVLGTVGTPINGLDFSSFLLQAQASKAKIIGLAEGGGDLTTILKQGAEYNIAGGGQSFATPVFFITDVHALGLSAARGVRFPGTFYWDLNDGTRAFSARFADRMNGAKPTQVQAGVYSAVLHYLRAVAAIRSLDGDKIVARMKAVPPDDPLFGKGVVRIDGRKISDIYLFEVKQPEESKGPWDYLKIIDKVPGEDMVRPLADGHCPLVK
jgi:branched-chain amino acid transport system substrate-binding protein